MARKISPPLSMYKKIAAIFIVLSFALIIGVFYFSLTYAFVDVEPMQDKVSRDFSLIVQADETKEDIGKGVFQGDIA